MSIYALLSLLMFVVTVGLWLMLPTRSTKK